MPGFEVQPSLSRGKVRPPHESTPIPKRKNDTQTLGSDNLVNSDKFNKEQLVRQINQKKAQRPIPIEIEEEGSEEYSEDFSLSSEGNAENSEEEFQKNSPFGSRVCPPNKSTPIPKRKKDIQTLGSDYLINPDLSLFKEKKNENNYTVGRRKPTYTPPPSPTTKKLIGTKSSGIPIFPTKLAPSPLSDKN